MKGPELPWSPEQEHLQEVQRNTFQEGQNELGGFRERKIGQVRVGRCGRPCKRRIAVKGIRGTVIRR